MPIVSRVINFDMTPTSGVSPLVCTFTNLSSGPLPNSWLWDFGDGDTSTLENPVHTYLTPGSYSPQLTADDGTGPMTTPWVASPLIVGYEYIITSADLLKETRITNDYPYTNLIVPSDAARPDNLPGMIYHFTKIGPGPVTLMSPDVVLNYPTANVLVEVGDAFRLIKTGPNEWDAEFIGYVAPAASGSTIVVDLAPVSGTLMNRGMFSTWIGTVLQTSTEATWETYPSRLSLNVVGMWKIGVQVKVTPDSGIWPTDSYGNVYGTYIPGASG